MLNILFLVALLVGIIARLLLNRFRREYLVTVVFGAMTLIGWCIAFFNFIPGNEGPGILAMLPTLAFVGSFLTGLILNLFGFY